MIKLIIGCAFLAACSGSREAERYLETRGAKKYTCSDGSDVVTCVADGVSYRCVVSNVQGCEPSSVACERVGNLLGVDNSTSTPDKPTAEATAP